MSTQDFRGIRLSVLGDLSSNLMEFHEMYMLNLDDDEVVTVRKGKNKETKLNKNDTLIYSKQYKLYKCPSKGTKFFKADDVTLPGKRSFKEVFNVKPRSELTIQDMTDLYTEDQRRSPTRVMKGMSAQYIAVNDLSEPHDCAFVSCPNGIEFDDLVTALKIHVQQKKVIVDEDDYFIWLDSFCSPPYFEEQEKRQVVKELDEVPIMIDKFNEALIYFDSVSDPTTLKRAWCVWEMYCASNLEDPANTPMSIIFSKKLFISGHVLIQFNQLMERVDEMDPTKLVSRLNLPEAAVVDYFKNLDVGWRGLQFKIREILCNWLVGLVMREYNTAQHLYHSVKKETTALFIEVGMFLVHIKTENKNLKGTQKLSKKCYEAAKAMYRKFEAHMERKIRKKQYSPEQKKKVLLHADVLKLRLHLLISLINYYRNVDYRKSILESFLGEEEDFASENSLGAFMSKYNIKLKDIEKQSKRESRTVKEPDELQELKQISVKPENLGKEKSAKEELTKKTKTQVRKTKNSKDKVVERGNKFKVHPDSKRGEIQIKKGVDQAAKFLIIDGSMESKEPDPKVVCQEVMTYVHIMNEKYDKAYMYACALNGGQPKVDDKSGVEQTLFGSWSMARIMIRAGRVYMRKGQEEEAVNMYKNGKELYRNYQINPEANIRSFNVDKATYLYAIALLQAKKKKESREELCKHFFPENCKEDEPLCIGCSARAVKVFILLAESSKGNEVEVEKWKKFGKEVATIMQGTRGKKDEYFEEMKKRVKKDMEKTKKKQRT